MTIKQLIIFHFSTNFTIFFSIRFYRLAFCPNKLWLL